MMTTALFDAWLIAPPARDRRLVYPVAAFPRIHRTRESIAYHEAGHAAVSMALGLPCSRASISDDAGWFSGYADASEEIQRDVTIEQAADVLLLGVKVNQPTADPTVLQEHTAIMLLAGLQSEMIHAGFPLDGAIYASDQDHAQARYLLRLSDTAPTLGYCQHYARALLIDNWAKVVEIGCELLKSGAWEN